MTMKLVRLCVTDDERIEDERFRMLKQFNCGHPRTDENTQLNRWNRKGRLVEWLRCKACAQTRAREYMKRRKQRAA